MITILELMTLSLFLIQYSPDLVTFAIDNTFSRTDKRFSISDKIIIYIMGRACYLWRRYKLGLIDKIEPIEELERFPIDTLLSDAVKIR